MLSWLELFILFAYLDDLGHQHLNFVAFKLYKFL